MSRLKVAVIGGGLFGCTAAVHAARHGHDVHLFDVKPEIMCGATAGTYARLHRGYHYPRSPETGRESRRAEKSFRSEYGGCVIDGGRQFYIVPEHGSKVSVNEFRDVLDNESLAFAEEDGVFEVVEPRVSLAGLAALVRQRVKDAGIVLHLGDGTHPGTLRSTFDKIIVATYAGLNSVLDELGCTPSPYKYQVVERPVVLLPESFTDTSVVVIDGPFGCLDPMDESPLHVLGHVTETVHAETTGYQPYVPDAFTPLINAGLIRNPLVSNVSRVIEELARYIPGVEQAVYIGSSFTVRAHLAHQEATDARPTLVQARDEQVMTIFSGKLGTAVRAAREAVDLLAQEKVLAA